MELAGFLLALVKAIPSIERIYLQTVDLYFKQQEAADQNRYSKKKHSRDAIITAMLRPGITEDELKDLRRTLYDLNRG
jgi:hypothetical protein